MTREAAGKLAAVIAAYADGAVIEFKLPEDPDDYWLPIEEPSFRGRYEYRVQPKDKEKGTA